MIMRVEAKRAEINVHDEEDGSKTVYIHYFDVDGKDDPDLVMAGLETININGIQA